MNKDEILKQFYITQVNALIERCSDLGLLDLIYRLLLNNEKEI